MYTSFDGGPTVKKQITGPRPGPLVWALRFGLNGAWQVRRALSRDPLDWAHMFGPNWTERISLDHFWAQMWAPFWRLSGPDTGRAVRSLRFSRRAPARPEDITFAVHSVL